MKRIIFIFVAILMVLNVKAESPIFFGGLKLGMTVSKVRQTLSNNNIALETKISGGTTSYFVKNPKLAGIQFQSVFFKFQNNKLMTATFISREGAGGDPNGPRFVMVSRLAESYRNYFNTLNISLQNKYGTPTFNGENQVCWNYYGNLIKLEYEFIESEEYGMRMMNTHLYLIYEMPNVSDL